MRSTLLLYNRVCIIRGLLLKCTFESHSPQFPVKALPPVTQKALSNYDISCLRNWSTFSGDI